MSDVGREIVEAAEAEIAKRYKAEPLRHWRRRDEMLHTQVAITHDRQLVAEGTFVATACGRVVGYHEADGDAEKTDCRECAEVYFVVHPPGYVTSGV